MILEVSRSFIKVQLENKIATVPGEMFFPPNDKMGFAIVKDGITNWDVPNENEVLEEDDVENIIADIKQDFEKGGHTLEVE